MSKTKIHWIPDISSTLGPGKNDQGVFIEMADYFGNKVILKTLYPKRPYMIRTYNRKPV